MKKISFILYIFMTINLQASVQNAWSTLVRSNGDIKNYPVVVSELINDGMYFTAIPYLKEYLYRINSPTPQLDNLLDHVVSNVGVKQFEILPVSMLKKSNAPIVKYLLAKKSFRLGKYKLTLQLLNETIPADHPTKPFALFLEASTFSLTKRYKSSVASYRRCVEVSRSQMRSFENENRLRQLAINRDYCLAGIARSQFAAGQFEAANSSYLDIDKDSFIWPELLFEEAWNSFYEKDFNRTLGKLVTYKAPILNYIFNPEVEVLKALTFLELCLWQDAQKVVNNFYNEYQEEFLTAKKFMNSKGRDYKYFYLLSKSVSKGKVSGNKLLNQLVRNIIKDAAYFELKQNFEYGKSEIERIKNLTSKKQRSVFSKNLRDSLVLQRDLIGAYVRRGIDLGLQHMEKSFEGMSYIKLEVLSKEKNEIYNLEATPSRLRGDIKNLIRNEKQYFWTFNGEFWADELGDYVFSLKSKCE